MVASNTKDCFRVCVGKSIKGVLFDALPVSRDDLADGTKTLVFEDGTGLTVASNGAFWLESEKDIERAIERYLVKLRQLQDETAEVIAAAGSRPPSRKHCKA